MTRSMRDLLLTAIGPSLWGSTYLITTSLLPSGRPLLAATLRALPAGLLLLLYYRKLPQGIWWLRVMILGTLHFGLFFALLFVAAYRLPGGVAAVIGAIQPLLVSLLAWPLLRERPTGVRLVLALGGVVGVALVVLGPAAHLDYIGLAASAGATLSLAVGSLLIRLWGRPVALPLFTAWQLVAGGLLLAGLTGLLELPLPALTGPNLLGFAYLGLLGTVLAYSLWFRGVERLGTATSFLPLCSPIVAFLLGVFVLREHLTILQGAGLVLAIGSVIGGTQATRSKSAVTPNVVRPA